MEPEIARERYKIEIVQRFVKAARLLEVGPSRGAFAYLAKENGFDVTVIERDPECCRFLHDIVGVTVLNATNPTAMQDAAAFDVVALWQVIEHLDDPWAFIRAAAARLRPGGALVCSTPNPDSLQFRLFGRFWAHLDAPRHLQLIPAETHSECGRAQGLSTVLLTSADADVQRHNVFGWQQSLANVGPKGLSPRLLGRVDGAWGQRIGSFEKGKFRGTTYTIVLQKASGAQTDQHG